MRKHQVRGNGRTDARLVGMDQPTGTTDPTTEPRDGGSACGATAYRRDQRAGLLRFAAGSRHAHGFGFLDERGGLVAGRGVELWITCRMTHVAALALLVDEPPAPGGPDREGLRDLAAHGVRSLLDGPLRDPRHDGWFAHVDDEGEPVADAKQAYGHAFVLLAAASALAAGVEGAERLLAGAAAVHDARFWDEAEGMVVEEWDRAWQVLEDYRGLNSTMHTVEAYLAVGDVTGQRRWHERAARMAARTVGWARAHDWRLPEHFDARWRPLPDHHRDQPAHPFRPFGATIGHGMEWARLLCSLRSVQLAAGGPENSGPDENGDPVPPGSELLEAALALADRAVDDGWAADGADGFVYTTDWEGTPVVRSRMHWVLAEAIAMSTVLAAVTGDARHEDDVARWWAYADRYLVDHTHGSWHHELDADNRPAVGTWSGKPDVYHAYQAALLADVPVAGSFAGACLRRGGAVGAG